MSLLIFFFHYTFIEWWWGTFNFFLVNKFSYIPIEHFMQWIVYNIERHTILQNMSTISLLSKSKYVWMYDFIPLFHKSLKKETEMVFWYWNNQKFEILWILSCLFTSFAHLEFFVQIEINAEAGRVIFSLLLDLQCHRWTPTAGLVYVLFDCV